MVLLDYAGKRLLNLQTYIQLQRLNGKFSSGKLESLMKKAYGIPFYREKFRFAGVRPEHFHKPEDLERFPVLTKRELREFIEDTVSACPEKYKNFYLSTTSGSTGSPLRIYYSPFEKAVSNANWLRILRMQGYSVFYGKTMAIRGGDKIPAHVDSVLQKLGILRRYTYSYLLDEAALVKIFNEIRPDCIYAHRSKLVSMALYACHNGITLYQPKVYASVSEQLDEASKKILLQAFGEGLFTSYGCEETGACTVTLQGSPESHQILQDTHLIHLYNENNKISDRGRMIITSLYQKNFPIINYDIGDYAQQDGTGRLKNIRGRLNDAFVFADGKNVNFQPFSAVVQKCEDILQIRFIQRDFHTISIIAVKSKASQKNYAQIEKEISQKLYIALAREDIKFVYTWADMLPADENGKTRFMKSEIEDK